MSKEKYSSGFYFGQKVVSTHNGAPDHENGWPVAGTIGEIQNFDPWDETHAIKWFGGFYDYGDHIAEPERTFLYWTYKKDGEYIFKPYIPEPKRLENGHRLCDHCACIIEDDNEEMIYIPDDGWVCKSCIELEYEFCAICKTYHKKGECHSVLTISPITGLEETMTICEDCLNSNGSDFYRCEDCHKWHDRRVNDYVDTGYGYRICYSCFDSGRYAMCEDCHAAYLKTDLFEVPGSSGLLCAECKRRFERNAIRGYSYKPTPKFKANKKSDQFDTDQDIKDLLFGVELEIDKGRDDVGCANELVHSNSDIYCKHDGSLSCGVEIVTHPCTLNYHLNELGWDGIVAIARKYGFTSHEAKTCGLHVHVGRRQLGDINERDKTIAKIVLAVNRHWDNMVKFARRLPSQLHWAEKNEIDFDDAEDEEQLIGLALETEEAGRYQAVNLCNTNTIEFRIFRGSLELNTIKATLELVSNICEYCMKHTVLEVMNSQWPDLAYFKEYTELSDYLALHNLAQTQIGMFGQLPGFSFTEINANDPGRTITLELPANFTGDNPAVDDSILHNYTKNRRVSSFEIGEYVLVTNTRPGEDYAPVGRIGRVIDDDGGGRVSVAFRRHYAHLHTCGHALETERGYNISPKCLLHYRANVYPKISIPHETEHEDELVAPAF